MNWKKKSDLPVKRRNPNHISSLEEAYDVIFGKLYGPGFRERMVEALHGGVDMVEIRVKFYKRGSTPGFTARVYYSERPNDEVPMHFVGLDEDVR